MFRPKIQSETPFYSERSYAQNCLEFAPPAQLDLFRSMILLVYFSEINNPIQSITTICLQQFREVELVLFLTEPFSTFLCIS